MKRLLCYLAFLVILVFLGGAWTAHAAEAKPDSFAQVATSWDQRLAYAESIIARSANTIGEHPQIREILLAVQRDASEAGKRFTADAKATQRLLDALGPEPEKGAPPEEKDVAETRAELQQKLAAARARVARTEIALSRARDLSTEVRDDFRNQFLQTLTQRLPLPDSIDDIRDGAREVSHTVFSIVAAPIAWWQGLSAAEKRLVFLHWQPYAALALLVAAILLSRPLLRRCGRDPSIPAPSYPRRLLAAFVSLATIGIVPALVLAATAFWVRAEASPIPGYPAHVVATLCETLIILLLIVAFAWAWLRPSDPVWRIAPLKTTSARRLFWRIILVGVIFAGHRFLLNGAAAEAIAALPVASRILYGVSYTVLAAIAIVLACRDNGWKKTRQNEAVSAGQPKTEDALPQIGSDALLGGDKFRFCRRFISFVVIVAIFAVSAGYVRLSYYLIDNILFTGMVLTALVILRRAGRGAFHAALAVSPRARKLDLSAGENQSKLFWAGLMANVLLAACGIFLIAPTWGIPRSLLWLLVTEGVEGFQIGSFTISLIDFALALVVLLIGLTLTQAGKRALSTQVLTHTRLDLGARQSIVTAAGYVGLVITSLLAISAMGLNLSNLAIIAGALSVGIGFGLQQIVNNFVSGLILLVERPVNIGDWIVVGGQEGHVRRISVRATEIETFQRASVIVPNAQLISDTVINWTHADKTGRLEITVGVAYGSDPEQVMSILTDCARAHPQMLAYPPPFALFMDFGASSLDFQLRGFIIDVNQRLSVASALRVAIAKALRDAGIEIPFPQQDVHLRDIDRLEAVLKQAAPAAPLPSPDAPTPLEPAPDTAARASPIARIQR